MLPTNKPDPADATGLHLPFVKRNDGLFVPAWYATPFAERAVVLLRLHGAG